MFNLYERRVVERLRYARAILKEEFNFSTDDTYYYQRDKLPWPKTEAEIQGLWKQRVKNDWLR